MYDIQIYGWKGEGYTTIVSTAEYWASGIFLLLEIKPYLKDRHCGWENTKTVEIWKRLIVMISSISVWKI